MTKILSTILTFIFLTGNAQTMGSQVKFKHTYFNGDGQISDLKEKSIEVHGMTGLEFYKTNFYRPYHFPFQFINKKYKSQTIIVWHDSTKTKSIESNWTYTYKYDSLSRVTDYSYSGCMICSQGPYHLQIKYDQQNRPFLFQVRLPLTNEDPPGEEYNFTYDEKGNIVQVRFFRDGKLMEQIDRL